MKRKYRDLDPRMRQITALDEAYFDLPDGPLRASLLAALRGHIRTTNDPAVAWLTERGLDAAGHLRREVA